MENIKKYEEFLNEELSIVNEAKILEKKGISPIIYKTLKSYFESSKTPTLKGAQEYINLKGKKWSLSKEDFEEAKQQFKK